MIEVEISKTKKTNFQFFWRGEIKRRRKKGSLVTNC
jgi:hypothetical protein